MSGVGRTQELKPSVLDRLIDPTIGTSDSDYYVNINRIKHSIRRDLENLLNSRRPIRIEGAALSSDDFNIVNYGVPDFLGVAYASQRDQNTLISEIRNTILGYESRFKSVRVVEKQGLNALDRTIRFRIEAELRVEPAVEPLVFDTELDPVSRELNVRERPDG